MALEKCSWCTRFFKADELTHSDHHGGKVCASCRADQGPGPHLNRATETVQQWPAWKKKIAGVL